MYFYNALLVPVCYNMCNCIYYHTLGNIYFCILVLLPYFIGFLSIFGNKYHIFLDIYAVVIILGEILRRSEMHKILVVGEWLTLKDFKESETANTELKMNKIEPFQKVINNSLEQGYNTIIFFLSIPEVFDLLNDQEKEKVHILRKGLGHTYRGKIYVELLSASDRSLDQIYKMRNVISKVRRDITGDTQVAYRLPQKKNNLSPIACMFNTAFTALSMDLDRSFTKGSLAFVSTDGNTEEVDPSESVKSVEVTIDEVMENVNMISNNAKVKKAVELAIGTIGSKKNVLIIGETGAGKELIAEIIAESKEKMKTINISAIPENLLESQLFGYKKGAFTGAVSDHIGILGNITEEVLFFDEIGGLSKGLQLKLLRVIENRTFYPVGAVDPESVCKNVRFVFATSSPENLMNDLYFRINEIEIFMPPLRERTEDFELFIKRVIPNVQMETSAQYFLSSLPWNGNIRELLSTLERIKLLNKDTLTKTDVENALCYRTKCGLANAPSNSNTIQPVQQDSIAYPFNRNAEIIFTSQGSPTKLKDELEYMKSAIMKKTSSRCKNNTEAAQDLGMDVSNYSKTLKKINST